MYPCLSALGWPLSHPDTVVVIVVVIVITVVFIWK